MPYRLKLAGVLTAEVGTVLLLNSGAGRAATFMVAVAEMLK